MRTVIAILIILPLMMGCGAKDPAGPSGAATAQTDEPIDSNQRSAVAVDEDQSFGIPNSFSGELSEDQEQNVPEALRGAFMIESLHPITTPDLAKELATKDQIVEEVHDGKRYVALRDFRCVEFPDGISGQMIVIERYVVTGE